MGWVSYPFLCVLQVDSSHVACLLRRYEHHQATWESETSFPNPGKVIQAFVEAAQKEGKCNDLNDAAGKVFLKEVMDNGWKDSDEEE